MQSWLMLAVIACTACHNGADSSPAASEPPSSTRSTPPTPSTPSTPSAPSTKEARQIQVCEALFSAVDRLGECARMRDDLRATYKDLARDMSTSPPRLTEAQLVAKCQMTIHGLRASLMFDCPELAQSVPDYPIPF